MVGIRFEWDSEKAIGNKRKHQVTFEEATTAFWDEQGLIVPDPDHSKTEERLILIGFSANFRLPVIVHCLRRRGLVIRILSARRATRSEASQYAKRWMQ
ncbi:MAG: BrnT family toxin [Candidatus Eisenbacteria bacterium]